MFTVLRGGCAARHPYPFYLSREHGVPNYVLLLVRTAGEFQIGETHRIASPGHAVLIAPGTPYHYHNPAGEYMDDWLHFEYTPPCLEPALPSHPDSQDRPYPLSKLTFPPVNTLFPLQDIEVCSALVRQLLWENAYTVPQFRAANIDALFFVLFRHLVANYETPAHLQNAAPFSAQLRAIRLELQNSPEGSHSIASYAKMLKISKSYFQHLYHTLFGISFQKDLIAARIKHAKELLTETDLTIDQISLLCGYRNEVHFYRQFRATVGYTPAKYRKRNRD